MKKVGIENDSSMSCFHLMTTGEFSNWRGDFMAGLLVTEQGW